VAWRIVSSRPFPSRGFSTIGTPAFSAWSRSDMLGWLVTRIAGAEKSRSRNCAMQPPARWNFFVDNQTIAVGQVARGQQFRSAGVAADGQALKLEPEFEGVSNGEVIADDDDDKSRVR
jgi:hypothetical protein